MKNPKGAGRKVKFKVPSKNYHFRVPNEFIKEFREIYKDKTERFLNK